MLQPYVISCPHAIRGESTQDVSVFCSAACVCAALLFPALLRQAAVCL
jgi:hypothetical protein